jgi:hypothetical protein
MTAEGVRDSALGDVLENFATGRCRDGSHPSRRKSSELSELRPGSAPLELSGEGEVWHATMRFTLSDSGRALTILTKQPPRPDASSRAVRCDA